MSKLFCLCADDFALTPSISEAILWLLSNQRIQATSCMTQSPLWPSLSSELSAITSPVQIGLHVNLTQLFTGNFSLPLNTLMIKAWSHQLDRQTILQSLQEQWQAFVENMGRQPDFVDGHQHVHQFPMIREVLLTFLTQQNFTGWVRNLANTLPTPANRFKTWLLPKLGAAQLQASCQSRGIHQNSQFAGVYDFGDTHDYAYYMQDWMANAPAGSATLLMCHPGKQQSDTDASIDPIANARRKEFDYLGSEQFLQDCQRFGVRLGHIGDAHD